MSNRLMVIGSGASTVIDRVYEEVKSNLTAGLSAQTLQLEGVDSIGNAGSDSLQFRDVADDVTATSVVQDPEAASAEEAVSLRSSGEGIVLVKALSEVLVPSFDLLGWNLTVAADSGLSVLYALDASGMSADLIRVDVESFLSRATKHHATIAGVVLTGARGVQVEASVPVLSSPISLEDVTALLATEPSAVTPIAFKADLLARAGANRKRIVLPEGDEPRILKATEELLAQGVADIVLIGDPDSVRAKAMQAGASIDGARIVSTSDPKLAPKYAEELAKIRASKGMTLEQAAELVAQPTYFATMMVQMGDADGMVSGATHTTADTIRPAFQIIKTAPGAGMVSSAFLMLMADRVLVMADCAVVVAPTSDQLAQIAISSANTARQFGIEPKVALLSYSTGTSGMGPSVDMVTGAVKKVREDAPSLAVEGPIQYDAAVDPTVGKQKAPDSNVAGQANVLVFPSLDAGNIAYKAVQRSSGAVAVGPILQGLNKPVNDLSRGALVEDIINTVAITAIQAEGEK
ncbi:phosphate acetyltransferase [Actinomycetaceae bacterium MB13-C1-2]|nr:phosphate acetyltransferase [Actinomycetaceae bacterium MB13-C1-2]